MSRGYILGSLTKLAVTVKDKLEESALWRFMHEDSALGDAVNESAIINSPELIKNKFSKNKNKRKEKTLAGRKPLKRAQERVGAIDASDLPKRFGYVFGGAVRESKVIAFFDTLWSRICDMPASLVGAMLLLTSISSFAVSLIEHIIKISVDYDTFTMCFSAVMFLIALLLLGSGTKSIYEIFSQSLFGSLFLKDVMGARFVSGSDNDERHKKSAASPNAFLVILLCLVICAISLWAGFVKVLLACLVISLVVAILKMPESGIILLLVAFPWAAMLENGIMVLAAVSVLITFSWIMKLAVGKRVYSVRLIDIVVGAFLVYYLLAGVWGGNGSYEIQRSVCYLLVGMLYFPISSLIRSTEWINRSMRAYVVGTIVVSFIGITQFIVRNISAGGKIIFGITSVMGGNQSLSAYLIVGIFIGIIVGKNTPKTGISFKISLIMNLVCLALAGSRTAYLAFAVAILIYLLMRKSGIVGALAFSLPFVIAIWIMMPETIRSSVGVLLENTDVGIRSKMFVWSNVLEHTKDYIWLGIGTGESALKALWSDCLEYLPRSLQFYNLYITTVVQTGIVGLVLLLVFVILALQRGFFILHESEKDSYFNKMSACIVSAFISLLVFGFGNSLWQDASLYVLFFVVVAWVRCSKEIYASEGVDTREAQELDIDLSTKRKKYKQSKEPLDVAKLFTSTAKKITKKQTKTNEEISITKNNSNEVVIQNIDLCEEESAWQRK